MAHHSHRIARVVAVLAACLTAAILAPAALAGPPEDEAFDVWIYETGGESDAFAFELADGGTYTEKCDYPHFSTTAYAQGRYEFAVKCYWIKLSGPATAAKLTVQLQYYDYSGEVWRNLGSPTVKTVGSNVKVTDAAACTPGTKRTLRGMLDTDIVGYNDPANKYIGPQRTATCSP